MSYTCGYTIHCIQVQCRFPLSHVAQSETCLDQSHFLEADSIHFIHTPSIPPFPMQQGVPECCTESFLTLQFSLLGNNTRRMFSHVLSIPTALAQAYIRDVISDTEPNRKCENFAEAQGDAGSSVYQLS